MTTAQKDWSHVSLWMMRLRYVLTRRAFEFKPKYILEKLPATAPLLFVLSENVPIEFPYLTDIKQIPIIDSLEPQ